MRILSKLIVVLLALGVVALGVGWYLLNSSALEMPLAGLEAKYKLPDSKWMELDGIKVHYVDQAPANVTDAPVVVLSHASFMSLRSWDKLAAALVAKGWRVIRMDYLNAGLTSFDGKGINDMSRNVMILEELPARLGVTHFDLVGTSSGGQVAFMFAGRHPERVGRFVLINSGGMPRTAQSNPNRARGSWLDQYINARYRSLGQWEKDLGGNMPSLRPLPKELVELVYDMNRREGGRPVAAEYLRNFKTGDTATYLAAVQAPIILLCPTASRAVTSRFYGRVSGKRLERARCLPRLATAGLRRPSSVIGCLTSCRANAPSIHSPRGHLGHRVTRPRGERWHLDV